ncbi:MAG: TldD/PmbA family protein [Candidatus Thorarchaeota archaeon]
MMDELQELIDNGPDNVYIEARYHKREQNEILIKKGKFERVITDDHTGIGIRVLVDGAFGYASTNSVEMNIIKKTLNKAITVAKNLAPMMKEKIVLAPIEPIKASYKSIGRDSLLDHSIEERISLAKEVDNFILNADSRIKGSMFHLREPFEYKIILNSDGSRVEISDTRPDIFIQSVAAENGKIMSFKAVDGITGGWEIFERSPPLQMAQKAVDISLKLLDAPLAKGGGQIIVMDPPVVGFICHEAIGHTVECDFVLAGSVVQGKIGKKVANEIVTMVDGGEQQTAGGWLPVDDVGVKTKPVKIIEKGELKSYLHSRATAQLFNVEPCGNERAFEYDNEPLIRMRNTYLEPGDFTREEIIEDVKFGYLLVQPGGGQADSTAEFMFTVHEAYEIRNGEIGNLVKNITLTGNAFEVLESIDAIGKNWELNSGSDFCYKWQPAKVDGGGGTTRAKAIISGELGES